MVSYQEKTLRLKLGLLLEGRPEDLEVIISMLRTDEKIKVIYEKLSTNPLTIIEKNSGGG